ncbi:TetR family transcriptional regulator [Eikenella sp. S3360]|uniref:TetR family transcriptional regulator n=1 Tax=Eikenella glucosivorans TaxID=2766967 RepID=A0ABS0N9K0_9NEIS|nr:TetR family transcriptional regulator [Eikenella glucosivorans]MBH5328978.1 TetR family transcriptional regulator [Eikenella glucosivorans]
MTEHADYTDPRIIKTHRAIREAFIDLLHEKPFAQIAVQDILDRAPVNRSTFYKYYSGKSDLAGKMIADFKAEYGALLRTRFQVGSFDAFLNVMPEASYWIHSRRRLILALWKVDTRRHHLYRDMHGLIKQQFLRFARTRPGAAPDKDWDYQADMLATIILGSMNYFFSRDLPLRLPEIRQAWAEMSKLLLA